MRRGIALPKRVTSLFFHYIGDKIGDMLTIALQRGVLYEGMADTLKQIGKQLVPILISAGAAAGLAFLQSIAHQAGACPAPIASPAEVGLLGGTIHMAINSVRAMLVV